MPELTYSDISCGVNQFCGFYDDYDSPNGGDGERTPESAFQHLVHDLKDQYNQSRTPIYGTNPVKYHKRQWPCGIILFSDVVDGPGHKFGEWLKEQFPNNPPVEQRGINPNTKSKIVAYVWALPWKELKAHALWKGLKVNKFSKYADEEEVW